MFKVGDKVKCIDDTNFKNCLTKNKLYTVLGYHEGCCGLEITDDIGDRHIISIEDRFELVKRETLKVPTLNHTIELVNGKFKVGCQNISWEDAQEIARYFQSIEKPEEPLEVGDFVNITYKRTNSRDKCILASIHGKYDFINLTDGRYYCGLQDSIEKLLEYAKNAGYKIEKTEKNYDDK